MAQVKTTGMIKAQGAPWLPPDDRLWRHPSEVRGNPSVHAGRPGDRRAVAGWLVWP
jgi:hypothetical protein